MVKYCYDSLRVSSKHCPFGQPHKYAFCSAEKRSRVHLNMKKVLIAIMKIIYLHESFYKTYCEFLLWHTVVIFEDQHFCVSLWVGDLIVWTKVLPRLHLAFAYQTISILRIEKGCLLAIAGRPPQPSYMQQCLLLLYADITRGSERVTI